MVSTAAPASLPEKSTNVRTDPLVLRLVRAGMTVGSHLSPDLTARIAEKLFFTPISYRAPAHEADWLDEAERHEVPFGDGHLATYEWGAGPTVLLVHGWSGRGLQMGGLAIALADAGFRAIAFDGPAHGDSSGKTATALDFMAAIRAVAEGHEPLAGIVGHSMGAASVTATVARGLAVDRVVLLSAPALLTEVVSRFADKVGLSAGGEQSFRRRFEGQFGTGAWRNFSPVHQAPLLRQPALIVHDTNDAEVPYDEGKALAQAWPNAKLLTTQCLGHTRILRVPAVAESIASFFSETTLPSQEIRHA